MSDKENGTAKTNPSYLKSWDKYSNSVADKRKTLLLPIKIGIENGIIVRERMNAKDVKLMYAKGRKDISNDWRSNPKLLPNPDRAVDHYLKFFRSELNENPLRPPNPLDLNVNRPVFLMVGLENKNWRFTKAAAYSVYNDMDDHTRNFFHVATMNSAKGLMLLNRHYSNPKGLKLDFCVDIKQTINRRRMVTPIIIDPGWGNAGAGFP